MMDFGVQESKIGTKEGKKYQRYTSSPDVTRGRLEASISGGGQTYIYVPYPAGNDRYRYVSVYIIQV